MPIVIPELDNPLLDPPPQPSAWFGVYPATVSDVNDPVSEGRVKVRLPWSLSPRERQHEAWARLATLMAGHKRGSWFIPDVGDEVLIAFEAGDASKPYVVGALWNSSRNPPEAMDSAGNNNKKVLRSRNGVTITLDDQDGQERIVMETPGGQKLTMKDGPGSIVLEDSHGNSLKFEAGGTTLTSSAKVTINAGSVAIAAGMLSVDAGMTKCSGVVQADTVITNSVVSGSYTPGAGNIW
jgi:uncharacterized protein involved in type VI secretion and phage assembly